MPAEDVDGALTQLQEAAPKLFDDLRLAHQGVEVNATPRRLVIAAKNLAPRQPDRELVVRGPSADKAFDASGKPTKAAEGFARSRGVRVDDLRIEEMEGGRYVVATVHETGRPAVDVLAEALPNVVAGIKFGKSMRWNASGIAFSRPIRWYMAVLGNSIVPFGYAGIQSGNVTRGLRPYGSPEHVVTGNADYLDVLSKQGILLNREERRAEVERQVKELADGVNGRVLHDSALVDEVTNLVEAPTGLRGRFEERYLQLPREVLVTVMRKKQRYFAVEDASGKLMPFFIAVRNGDAQHLDLVIHGNEEVLRARFSDAEYFFGQDRQKKLEEFLPRLGTLTFQEKLGSMLDKNERVAKMVEPLGKLLGLDTTNIAIAQQAAYMLKADLATQMVVEMTSLQGTMGREYALLSGYPREVADAIFEHWLPRGADDMLPPSQAGTLLAIADRLDTLTGLFAAGLAPQSTADPYGQRRAALGIIQIVVNKAIDIDLAEAVALAARMQPISVSDEVKAQVLEFIGGRLRSWLEDQDWRHDVVEAVLAEQSANPHQVLLGIRELSEWVKRPNWEQLLDGFARCVRITRSEATQYEVKSDLLVEPEEKALWQTYESATVKLTLAGNVDEFLKAFEPMLPAITAFFDKVLVMAEDAAVRQNRLGLLQAISAMQRGRADLSHLSGF